MRVVARRIVFFCFAFLLLSGSFIGSAPADVAGRLIVRIEGKLAGPLPPTLEIAGPELRESAIVGAVAISAGGFRYEGIVPGVYRATLSGGAGGARSIELGVFPGRTTVLMLDLANGSLVIDPDRPDPFGVDDAREGTAAWNRSFAAETSPFAPREARLDGVDLAARGFRRTIDPQGTEVARASMSPIGPVSASDEIPERLTLSDSRTRRIEVEGASGTRGGGFGEGTLIYGFDRAPWKPRVLASVRPLRFTDAAPSVFGGGKLPHNDLDALDLYARADLEPAAASRLSLFLYGQGTRRNYFLESYKFDADHSPRQDGAEFAGAARLTHALTPRTKLLAEAGWQRTFVATGDGLYYDNLVRYLRPVDNPGLVLANGLYWAPGHVYNYYRKNVEVDLTGRAEVWRDPGTSRAIGAGLHVRRGTYRSFEQLNPAGAAVDFQAIGYDSTGTAHDDTPGNGPGTPLTLAGFAVARRPFAGGDVEIGARGTFFRSGARPLQDIAHPFTGSTEDLLLGSKRSRTTVDPRIAFTRAITSRARIWLAAAGTTRVPPSEALYYSEKFVKLATLVPESAMVGNPGLSPEREWSTAGAIGLRAARGLSFRLGGAGRRTDDAITAKAFPITDGTAIFAYANGGRRELLSLFARATWEPSPALKFQGSYDLSRARTESLEPAALDEQWAEPNLPIRGLATHEGLPPLFPAFDAEGAGTFPSILDRPHRFAAVATVRPPMDLIGESGRPLLQDLELSAAFHAASGGPFTVSGVYPAGVVPGLEPRIRTEGDVNGGRMPWIGRLDLRISREFPVFGARLQGWAEVLNVTGRHNALHVYHATGLPDTDGSARMGDRNYDARLADPILYDLPRVFQAGARLVIF